MKSLTYQQIEAMFDSYLDETFPPVILGGFEYDYAVAWKSVAPTSWGLEFSDWVNIQLATGRLIEVDGEYYLAGNAPDGEST